jgi:hypothetical protein
MGGDSAPSETMKRRECKEYFKLNGRRSLGNIAILMNLTKIPKWKNAFRRFVAWARGVPDAISIS